MKKRFTVEKLIERKCRQSTLCRTTGRSPCEPNSFQYAFLSRRRLSPDTICCPDNSESVRRLFGVTLQYSPFACRFLQPGMPSKDGRGIIHNFGSRIYKVKVEQRETVKSAGKNDVSLENFVSLIGSVQR